MNKPNSAIVKKSNNKGISLKTAPKYQPQEYLQNAVILGLSIAICLFIIYKALDGLAGFTPVSDELANIFAVQSIYLKGIPIS